jgi:hypothetical protein
MNGSNHLLLCRRPGRGFIDVKANAAELAEQARGGKSGSAAAPVPQVDATMALFES